MDSVLCFLGYLLLNFEAATFRADVDFFSFVSRLSRLHSRTVTGRSQRCFCRERGPEILE